MLTNTGEARKDGQCGKRPGRLTNKRRGEPRRMMRSNKKKQTLSPAVKRGNCLVMHKSPEGLEWLAWEYHSIMSSVRIIPCGSP